MSDDNSNGNSPLVKIENVHLFGKETDAALAEIVRGALGKPTSAVGDLVESGVGILHDHVRIFRMANTADGVLKVKRKLEAKGINAHDAQRISEGNFYELLDGMSRTDDAGLQDMWSQLIAEAMDPKTSTKADRSFTSVLNQMTPMDAKVLNFIGFAEAALRQAEGEHRRKGNAVLQKRGSADEMMKKAQELSRDGMKSANMTMSEMGRYISEHGLETDDVIDSVVNLVRLGVIAESLAPVSGPSLHAPRGNSSRDIQHMAQQMQRELERFGELERKRQSPVEEPKKLFEYFSPLQLGLPAEEVEHWVRVNYVFTQFGLRLGRGCGFAAL
ncbi:MAG: DUF4393 domain-containing protein [Rhodobacteraceae bacterium]|nr:DUF4393 domain-containing protein [Paracoccaceae bacterium]MCW9041760.1 DUF4393 domain-containing protein [Pseudopelagicola sp.]